MWEKLKSGLLVILVLSLMAFAFLARSMSFGLTPPENLPVFACEKTRLMYSVPALKYDARVFYAYDKDTMEAFEIVSGKPYTGPLDPARNLVVMSYGDAVHEGCKPDGKHHQYLERPSGLLEWIAYRVGLRKEPWTPRGNWRELTRSGPL